jgi:hypothetical protein
MAPVYDSTSDKPWICPGGECSFESYKEMAFKFASCTKCERL